MKQNIANFLGANYSAKQRKEFFDGVAAGFVEGVMEWVRLAQFVADSQMVMAHDTGISLAAGPWGAPSAPGNYFGARLTDWLFGEPAHITQARRRMAQAAAKVVDLGLSMGQVVKAIPMMMEVSSEVFIAMDRAGAFQTVVGGLGSQVTTLAGVPGDRLGNTVGKVIDNIHDPRVLQIGLLASAQLTPYNQGYLTGVVLYEAAETAVLSAFTGGVAAAIKLPRLIMKIRSLDFIKDSAKLLDKVGEIGKIMRRGPGNVVQRTNAQLVRNVATRAEAKIGGTGRFAGTDKHVYAHNVLDRYQRMFGDRGLSTEVRYINQAPWQAGDGLRGSIRLDVVEGNLRSPTAVFDYKFGSGGLTPGRISQIRQAGNFAPNLPINTVHP